MMLNIIHLYIFWTHFITYVVTVKSSVQPGQVDSLLRGHNLTNGEYLESPIHLWSMLFGQSGDVGVPGENLVRAGTWTSGLHTERREYSPLQHCVTPLVTRQTPNNACSLYYAEEQYMSLCQALHYSIMLQQVCTTDNCFLVWNNHQSSYRMPYAMFTPGMWCSRTHLQHMAFTLDCCYQILVHSIVGRRCKSCDSCSRLFLSHFFSDI